MGASTSHVRERVEPQGRGLNVTAYGDTATEIEAAALDEARAFFGDDHQLSIVRDYHVWQCKENHPRGKRYHATIMVADAGWRPQ